MFKAALTGGWMEGGAGEETKEIDASDWNTEAFRTVMNVVHGRSQLVPRSVSLDQVYKIALIVDYYELHDAMNFVGKSWVDSLRSKVPTDFASRIATKWLAISWVFRDAIIFQSISRVIMLQSPHTIGQHSGIPIPSSVVGMSSVAPIVI
jgi:hypothetical protein